jgi:hypothetical protein
MERSAVALARSGIHYTGLRPKAPRAAPPWHIRRPRRTCQRIRSGCGTSHTSGRVLKWAVARALKWTVARALKWTVARALKWTVAQARGAPTATDHALSELGSAARCRSFVAVAEDASSLLLPVSLSWSARTWWDESALGACSAGWRGRETSHVF